MKFLAVFAVALAVANADVSHILGQAHHHHHEHDHEHAHLQPSADAQAAIVRSSLENPGNGAYSFAYETQNGIRAEENGQLKQAQAKNLEDAITAQGSYSYTAPDGQSFQVQYIADENGYQPQGAHLPVAPAIPEYILRSIEYNNAHPEQENQQ